MITKAFKNLKEIIQGMVRSSRRLFMLWCMFWLPLAAAVAQSALVLHAAAAQSTEQNTQQSVQQNSSTQNAQQNIQQNSAQPAAANTNAAQSESEKRQSELTRLAEVLKYGTDSSVVDALKTLAAVAYSELAPNVVERMRSAVNEDVLVEGFRYLRAIKYQDAIELAFSYVQDFAKYTAQTVQFALFYLQDNKDRLNAEQKKSLEKFTVRIVQDDNPAMALAALEAVSSYYDEASVPYNLEDAKVFAMTDEEIAALRKSQQDSGVLGAMSGAAAAGSSASSSSSAAATPQQTQQTQTPAPVVAKEPLFSRQLALQYGSLFTEAIKDQIVMTLGSVHAYNALLFLFDIAEDPRISQARRAAVIEALGAFDLTRASFEKERAQRLDIFERARTDKAPRIRSALFKALRPAEVAGTAQSADPLYADIPGWLLGGLRDNDASVRITVLGRIADMQDAGELSGADRKSFFDAVTFMVENDQSSEVRSAAISALATFNEGSAYILDQVKNMKTMGLVQIKYISAALGSYADKGGVEAIASLVDKTIDNAEANNFFSDSLAVMQEVSKALARTENPAIKATVQRMLGHPDTTIKTNMLTAIAKNKFTDFLPAITAMVDDINLPADVRVQARRTVEILEGSK